MISYQAVLQQLEKQLLEAKSAGSEQQIREALTAIRALCNVVLDIPMESFGVQHKQLPQMLPKETQQPMLYTEKVQEEDGANGDSIFDF